MAFSIRVETPGDFTQLQKQLSKDQAMLMVRCYDAVAAELGWTIVAGVGTDGGKFKVPNSFKDEFGESQGKGKIHSALVKHGINKTAFKAFGNGSTGGGTSAVDTKMQENGSLLYFQHYIETGKFPSDKEIRKIYPKATDDWITSFETQSVKLKEYLGAQKNYNYSRDDGIMPFIENLAKQHCGVSTIDNWNPADVYIVKKDKEKEVREKLGKCADHPNPKAARDYLNECMQNYVKDKILVGISLKALKPPTKASIEETNFVTKTRENPVNLDSDFKCSWELLDGKMFKSTETQFFIRDNVKRYSVQIRTFTNSNAREQVQMEITPVGGGAKLGKVSADAAIDPYLSGESLTRPLNRDVPKQGQFTQRDIDQVIALYNELKSGTIGGQKVLWDIPGDSSFEMQLRMAVSAERTLTPTARILSAKIQGMKYLKVFKELDRKGKLNSFLNVCYYGAKKEYEGAGPFVKIS